MSSDHRFAIQTDVRGPWRAFLDEIAPLRPDLFRYCCGLTGNVWDGEDLAQDTLARVFSLLGKIDADLEHPRAYLVRAATHLWIDRLRHAGVERRHAEGVVAESTTKEDPERGIVVREAASVLFRSLPPQERAAVLLKDVLDFSLEETAAMLKTTVGAVKSALHRGRARLETARRGSEPTESEGASPEPRAVSTASARALVERFVTALAAKDFEAIRAMCLPDATIDMVGGARAETYEEGKMVVEHAHLVLPEWGFGEDPHWRVAEWEGEPIAIGFRKLDGVLGLNEIWRFEADEDGRVTRVRLYCFSPDVLAEVARGLGIPALKRPYRSPP